MNRIPSLNLFQRAIKFKNQISIQDYGQNSYTYAQLLNYSNQIGNELLKYSGKRKGNLVTGLEDLDCERVSFFLPPSFNYVKTKWGIWNAGGVAVPLSTSHPPHELEYVISNSKSSLIVTDEENYDKILEIGKKLQVSVLKLPNEIEYGLVNDGLVLDNIGNIPVFNIDYNRNAMIIYTSGTTSRPKGVVTTHGNIESQITTLTQAWGWSSSDKIIQVLPLHHVHGVINCTQCALYSGAQCEMMPSKFNPELVINRIIESMSSSTPITLFMAVPTIYSKLIKYIEEQPIEKQMLIKEVMKRLRLNVSGSSALPETIHNRWKELTGQVILERYGMTEIGMALSNPLEPINARIPGTVGFPLPKVQVKVHSDTKELLIKGPQVFKEYFDKPEATKEAFDSEGWFKTGDIVDKDEITGRFKILGRSSVDIIKYSGFKISALEIERELLESPHIDEVCVLGVPDQVTGEKITAIIVPKNPSPSSLPSQKDLQEFCKSRLAYYKTPSNFIFVKEIPKNAMSKVNKKDILKNLNNLDYIK